MDSFIESVYRNCLPAGLMFLISKVSLQFLKLGDEQGNLNKVERIDIRERKMRIKINIFAKTLIGEMTEKPTST